MIGVCGSRNGYLRNYSYEYTCIDGEVFYRNYTNTNCSGDFHREGNVCEQETEQNYICTSVCDSGACEAVLHTDYYDVTGCDGDYPSGYDQKDIISPGIIGFCGRGYSGNQVISGYWDYNDTHIYSVWFDSLDCSGEQQEGLGYTYKIGPYCGGEYEAHEVIIVAGDGDVDDAIQTIGSMIIVGVTIFAVIMNMYK